MQIFLNLHQCKVLYSNTYIMNRNIENINIFDEFGKYTNKTSPVVSILTHCFGSVCFVNYISKEVKIKNNLTRVKHVATGFMMIHRDVIEKMTKSYSATKYTDDVNFLTADENKYAYALFDCGVVDDHYLSEDWMFCNR